MLNNVSLNIMDNEIVSIIGHVGSGRNTLLRCIAGLDKVDCGSVEVNGNPIMVFEQNNLFPNYTILQNLTLPLCIVKHHTKEEAEKIAIKHLEEVGMAELVDFYPEKLSLGQRKRVAIARALAMNPSVLLLDEPTSALDPVSASGVFDLLHELKKKKTTIVLITNDMPFAKSISDRLVVMHSGKIIEIGTPQQVFIEPKHPLTQEFIKYSQSLVYTISSARYDYLDLNARIEQYCNRFAMGAKAYRTVQLVVEELVNLIPLDSGAELTVLKSQEEIKISIDVVLPNTGVMYLEETPENMLSVSIITGLCAVAIENNLDNGSRLIHLELEKNSLID